MAAVDMRHVNFWLPRDFHPNNSSKSKPKSAVVTQRHEFPTHSEDDSVKAQGACEAEHLLEEPI
jgi:hypothetical protein